MTGILEIARKDAPQEKPKLSQVINYDQHIAPYRIIQLISGLGSGKNYWVENELMPKYNVLLVTSRKSKVDETKNKTGLSNCLNLNKLADDEIKSIFDCNIKYHNAVCNNWQIEYYMKNVYNPADPSTYLWQFFDHIIIDEAHSLATDATFCDAPFYVVEFIKAVYTQGKSKIIMMTATPNIIKDIIPFQDADDYKYWDFTDQCRNILPHKLTFKTKDKALEELVFLYNSYKGKKWQAIYFATRTKNIKSEIIPYLIANGIPEEEIAVSFSNEDAREDFSETILNNKERTENHLALHEDLPKDIRIFISTSRNKEGINIENEFYSRDIIIESQWIDEIKQMWGRVRTHSPETTIIHNANQHARINLNLDFDYRFDLDNLELIQEYFDNWCGNNGIMRGNRFLNKKSCNKIEQLHEKRFPYIRYSPVDDKLILYAGKIAGEKDFYNSIDIFQDYVVDLIAEKYDNIQIDSNPFGFDIPTDIINPPTKLQLFESYIKEKGYLDNPMSPADQDDLLYFISKKLHVRQERTLKAYTRLGSAVKKLGYTTEECTKHTDNPLYGYYYLKKITE